MTDEKRLQPEERQALELRLKVRTERFLKCLKLDAPDNIMGMMLFHVWQTGVHLYGTDLLTWEVEYYTKENRRQMELCYFCGKPLPLTGENLLCPECDAEMAAMDEDPRTLDEIVGDEDDKA